MFAKKYETVEKTRFHAIVFFKCQPKFEKNIIFFKGHVGHLYTNPISIQMTDQYTNDRVVDAVCHVVTVAIGKKLKAFCQQAKIQCGLAKGRMGSMAALKGRPCICAAFGRTVFHSFSFKSEKLLDFCQHCSVFMFNPAAAAAATTGLTIAQ